MNRIDEIVKEAERRLNAFYGYYGEWDGKGKKVKKRKKDEDIEDDDLEPEELKDLEEEENSPSEKPEKSENRGRPSKKYLFDDTEEENEDEPDLFSKDLSKEDESDFFKDGPIAEPKVIKKIEPPKRKSLSAAMIKPVKKLETKKNHRLSENQFLDSARDSSGNEINFEGLKSIEIINKVKELTGEHINICVKSKKNVIRHAIIILKERGYIIR